MTTTTALDLSLTQMPKHDFRCKWCGGNLAKDEDDEIRTLFLSCIQCGREHDLNGELVRHGNGHHT